MYIFFSYIYFLSELIIEYVVNSYSYFNGKKYSKQIKKIKRKKIKNDRYKINWRNSILKKCWSG